MAKSDAYSWRIDPATRSALEDAARQRQASVAAVLDEIVGDWLSQRAAGPEAEHQQDLHRTARRYIGAIEGHDPHRAESVRERLRARLSRRHAG